jgi:hypothetical protein
MLFIALWARPAPSTIENGTHHTKIELLSNGGSKKRSLLLTKILGSLVHCFGQEKMGQTKN